LFFIQGMSLIRPPMPSVGFFVVDFLNANFRFGSAGAKCFFSSYDVKTDYIVTMVTPIVCFLIVGIIYLVGLVMPSSRLLRSLTSIGDPISWKLRNVRAIVFLLYFGYMGCSQVILFPLVCEEDPGIHKTFMMNAASERCSTALRVCSGVLIALYIIALPLLSFIWIRKVYDDEHQSAALGLLVSGYPRKFRFWEIATALRRVLFLCGFFLFESNSQVSVVWVAYLLLLSIMIQFVFRPYGTTFENLVEILSLSMLLVNLAVWLGFQRSETSGDGAVKIVVLIVNAAFLLVLVFFSLLKCWGRVRSMSKKLMSVSRASGLELKSMLLESEEQ